ncbi:zinc finger protein jing homolog [Lutzomyia longipalpis]|uniref:zinc finger protein jing homolog n=1 Tax=Lutzomyia longipalpis TaxID=7200 RepID=UPI00248341F5|nr:zinc finger protein jing homolog [Lutzomyia longipalpis]
MADSVVCLDDDGRASKSETCALSATERSSANSVRICGGSDLGAMQRDVLKPPQPPLTALKPPPPRLLAPPAVPGSASGIVRKNLGGPSTSTAGALLPPSDPGADPESEECRKKRCADRYDSSESSDSGVAALSCTDSSTTSSDTSDPGSPYSSASLEELHSATMAPRQGQSTPSTTSQITPHQWPWSSSLPSPITPASASSTSSNNNNSTTSNNNLKRTDGVIKMLDTPKRIRLAEKKTSTPNAKLVEEVTPPQTKITGYFKTQMKPVVTTKKDLTNLVIRSREFPKAKVETRSQEARKKSERKTKQVPAGGVAGPKKVAIFNKLPVTPPKRPVTIAPRVPTEKKPIEQLNHQPTVVLTAIRLPPGATHTTSSLAQSTPSTAGQIHAEAVLSPSKAAQKVNPVFQVPVVSNFVQIPNILTKGTTTNLLMNGGHLARINGTHPGQYFLNGATVLKLATSNTGTLTSIDESGKSTLVPLTKTPSSAAQFPANGFASPVFMTTPQGILLNATLPTVISSQYSNLNQIQTTATNLLPSFSTLLQQTQHHQSQASCYQYNQAPPVVPNIPASGFPASFPSSKMPQAATVTAAPTITEAPPKMSPVTVNVDATTPVVPHVDATTTTADLRSPTLPTQTPERPAVLPSPISLVLENIQKKTFPDLDDEEPKPIAKPPLKSPRIDTDLLSANLPECAKSPILSQPKTIRFPPQNGELLPKGARKSDGRIVGVCYWDQCTARFDSSSKLLDHLQTQHVTPQTVPFSCLWAGCKVHSRQSCSRRWLEGHVLSHGGPKPFKCIFDGCGQRFGSRVALEKHVNSHLNTTENHNHSANKRSSDVPVPKLIRRNGKKLRYRRQPWSARMFDFFDSGIMEGLQHRLKISSSYTSGPDGSVMFTGRRMGRRVSPSGITEIYVTWTPCNIISDEWIQEPKDTISPITKTVAIESLAISERIALQAHLRSLYRRDRKSLFDSSSAPKFKVLKTVVTATGSPVAILNDFSVCPRQSRKHHRKPPKKVRPS